jgi:hypothetical protein
MNTWGWPETVTTGIAVWGLLQFMRLMAGR